MNERALVGQAALIVIDMQEGAYGTTSGIPRMGGYSERVQRVSELIAHFRDAGIPIIFVREEHRRSFVDFGRELDGNESVHCLEGDTGTEIAHQLDVREDDIVIAKRRYSSFFATDFDLILRNLDIETVVLVGELTDVCVHLTFADAHQHDYVARVVIDCCGGSSIAAHDAALNAMAYLQKDAWLTSAELLAVKSVSNT